MQTWESPFRTLDTDDLRLITQEGQTRTFPKNTLIVMEGDVGHHFYYIESGKVKVYSSNDQGREVLLKQLNEGDYFGELALFDEAPRSANVAALKTTRLKIVSREIFLDCLRRNPDLAFKMILGLSGLVRSLTQQVQSLSLLDVYGRLRQNLMQLSVEKAGKRVIDEPMTHQEFANRIGSSREMVSRIMKTLVDGAYIVVERKRIEILRELPEHW